MNKSEQVYREILYQCMEKRNKTLTQKELSVKIGTSLSNVSHCIRPLLSMGAIQVNPRNFKVVSAKKILFYWASMRNLGREVVYKTRVDDTVTNIEKSVPNDIVFTAYSAYKLKFKDVPADYSEVYIYSGNPEEIKRRFGPSNNPPNLFVLKNDEKIEGYGKTVTIANLFVDLWNLKEWYARDFLNALEARLNGILE